MNERVQFIAALQTGELNMSQACAEFRISRVTGYKWLRRYEREGVPGLTERSRGPLCHPNATSPALEAQVLAARGHHPRWGPKKLRWWLVKRHPDQAWPAVSTLGAVLKRHGLTVARRRRHRATPYTQPFIACQQPNSVWSVDFKGQFQTGDGHWCYPLTVSDAYSRYLLSCRGLQRTTTGQVRPWLERAFREYGLPLGIRSDNGPPFASTGLAALSRLSVWWIRLGIVPERIEPGHPEQNGRHERLHRTLKQDTVVPPKLTLIGQQRAFNRFRHEYNHARPHEALGQREPARVYAPSPRPYPKRLPEVTYGPQFQVRRVRHNGEIKWQGQFIYLSQALRGEPIGIHRVHDHHWHVYFGPVQLGVIKPPGGFMRPVKHTKVLTMCPV